MARGEIARREPFRQKFYVGDCHFDSRRRSVEQSEAEEILSVTSSDAGAEVIMSGLGITPLPLALPLAACRRQMADTGRRVAAIWTESRNANCDLPSHSRDCALTDRVIEDFGSIQANHFAHSLADGPKT